MSTAAAGAASLPTSTHPLAGASLRRDTAVPRLCLTACVSTHPLAGASLRRDTAVPRLCLTACVFAAVASPIVPPRLPSGEHVF